MMTSLANAKTVHTAYLLNTDIGQDWDDEGMLDKALELGLTRVMVLTSSGNTFERALDAASMLQDEKILSVSGSVVTFTNHAGKISKWRFLYAEPESSTKHEAEGAAAGFLEPEPWSVVKTPFFCPFDDGQRHMHWGVLFAAPPCGYRLLDLPVAEIEACVFVGNDPRGQETRSRGVNGGAGLSETSRLEIDANLSDLDRCLNEDVLFVPPSVTRKIFASTSDLRTMRTRTRETLLRYTERFLLGPRPSHLPEALQLRVAEANRAALLSLRSTVCPAQGVPEVLPHHVRSAERYAEAFPGIPASDRSGLVEATACIYAVVDEILSKSSRSYGEGHALGRYLAQRPLGSEATLLPKYDVTGLQILCILQSCPQSRTLLENVEGDSGKLTMQILQCKSTLKPGSRTLGCFQNMPRARCFTAPCRDERPEFQCALYPSTAQSLALGFGYGYEDGALKANSC